jgi:hypothetical protein
LTKINVQCLTRLVGIVVRRVIINYFAILRGTADIDRGWALSQVGTGTLQAGG